MARQYAPAMTKQQFKAVRPNGNYDNYLSYLERNRPGWKRPQAAIPQHMNPPMRGPSYTQNLLLRRLQILTPQQMEAQANRMANAQVKAQRGILDAEYKTAADDAMRRMLAFQSAGRAAAALNSGLIGQVGGMYQSGADQLAALANSGAASMAAATDASVAGANQAISNAGVAPPVTVGGPVGQEGIAGSMQAGVENYYSGTLGRQAFENAGGYAKAGIAGQIQAQNLRATQEAQAAYMSAMEQANANKAAAVKELVAGRPANAMQYLAQLQDNQRQAIALASSMVGAEFAQGMTKKEYAQKVKQQRIENDQWKQTFNENVRQFNKKLKESIRGTNLQLKQVNTELSRATGFIYLNNGKQFLDKNGQPVKVQGYGTGGVGGTGGLTAYQYSRLMPKAQQQAEDWRTGYVVGSDGKRYKPGEVPDDVEVKGGVQGRLSYAQVVTRLQRMGLPPQAAQAIANDYYDPMEGGRPPFDQSQLAALKQRYGQKGLNRILAGIKAAIAAGDGKKAMYWWNLASSGAALPKKTDRTTASSGGKKTGVRVGSGMYGIPTIYP